VRISIVTSALNAAPTIEATIRSVLAQGGDLDYLVVDGGSTDGTLDIVRRYEGAGVRCVSEPDAGISDAFNKGIARTTGEVIGIISADDELWPGALQRVSEAFAAHPEADVVYGNAVYLEKGGRRSLSRPEPDFANVLRRSPLRHAATFVRRSAYERFGVFDLQYRLAMDYELVLRFHSRGAKFVYVDAPLAGIREGGASAQRFRQTIAETRRISVRYGLSPLEARLTSWRHVGWTLLKRGLEGAGLTWVIDRYRAGSPRFGEMGDDR
jgi:glycosyltransferase involved in cell wall biosynthesis